MRLFVSWSGARAQYLAAFLDQWIQHVIGTAEVFMSSEDIGKGDTWFTTLADELAAADCGLIVVTPENQDARWLNFEAGAIYRQFGERRACPLVLGMDRTDLGSPLSAFNATEATYDDVRRLLLSIRPPEIPERVIEHNFDREWPDLERAIKEALAVDAGVAIPAPRTDSEKIDELLDLMRQPRESLSLAASSRSTSPPATGVGGGVRRATASSQEALALDFIRTRLRKERFWVKEITATTDTAFVVGTRPHEASDEMTARLLRSAIGRLQWQYITLIEDKVTLTVDQIGATWRLDDEQPHPIFDGP